MKIHQRYAGVPQRPPGALAPGVPGLGAKGT